MRTRYDIARKADAVRPGEGRGSRWLAKVATLTFWIPLLSVDLWIVTRSGVSQAGLTQAGDLLFRETLVYLAFWMLVALIQGLLFGRGRQGRRRRSGANLQDSSRLGNAALNRERSGL